MATATIIALETNELLEHILSFLPHASYDDILYLNPIVADHVTPEAFIGEYVVNAVPGSCLQDLLDVEGSGLIEDAVAVSRRVERGKQFLTQPACTVAQLTALDDKEYTLYTRRFIVNDDGITLGDAASVISSVWSQLDVKAKFGGLEPFVKALELDFEDMKKVPEDIRPARYATVQGES